MDEVLHALELLEEKLKRLGAAGLKRRMDYGCGADHVRVPSAMEPVLLDMELDDDEVLPVRE